MTMTKFSKRPPLKPPREALSISGIITYMTINKLSIMTKILTTASASLGTIVVINDNNDDGLTTRQGASFETKTIIILLPHYAPGQALRSSTERKPHVQRPSDRRYSDVSVSWHKDTIVC